MAGLGELQAIILAGGKGERLRPFTDDRPKPMVPILDKPILEYQIRWLAAQGIKRIVISCGYRHEVIQHYFADGEKFGVELRYAVEEEPLGRGGGIKLAWNELAHSDAPVVATNGDIMTSFDLGAMLAAHRRVQALASILTVPFVSQYGIVDLDDEGKVTGFRSEPVLPYWVNGGVYVLEPSVHAMLPDRGDHEASTFPQLAQLGKLLAFKSHTFWRAVDTVKDLTVVKDYLTQQLLNAFLAGAPGAARPEA
ncbi:MAG TPA: nucleotidyltransferase family protein [Chloroflexota bacterium]|nr:nucleotidyltransferase family protein [Chloroflexota bacterium]